MELNLSGKRIRIARRGKGLSQEQIAARLQLNGLNTSQGVVSQMECGLRTVSDYELKAIAKVLNKPVEWFLEE